MQREKIAFRDGSTYAPYAPESLAFLHLSAVLTQLVQESCKMVRTGGDNVMLNAEPAQGQFPELAALRECLTDLALPPDVRQTLDGTFTESEKRLQQRLEQMTWQVQRSTLLGDLAGKIVHEIRNPLNAIFLHADVMLGELQCPTLDSRTQMMESLTDIRMEVRRLYDIMQDYLTLARLPVVQYEPEDMGDFLRECGRVMQEQARARGIGLHLQGLARLGSVSLHKGSLQHAFMNLLQRALHAMPQGGTMTLRGRRTASHSVVEIRDTGSAISEEHLDLLFKPWFSTGSEWTGLGLYVVREIIMAHHGTIDVHSVAGQGTTFTVTLPLVRMEGMSQA
jgi:two-component system sporulation sensor kinase C